MENPIIEVNDLKVIYKTDEAIVEAVNGISFSIDEGETLGLVGETGAGKTTTALSVIGLLPERVGKITEGSIKFRGEDLSSKSKHELRLMRGDKVSMIFQDPMTSLNPVMTVGDQILESINIHSPAGTTKKEMEERVDEILSLVGIVPERKKEYPHQFSGGMKQRIVIAIALACEPELLIADEPTSALDVTIQAQVLALMNDLKEKLRTSMIMITHDLGLVAEMCDKVAIMYAGEIVEYGTVQDIFEGQNHHPYTTGLFGAIPDMTNESKRLTPIEGLMPDPANLPSGCKFHPRCSACREECKSGKPFEYAENGHRISCNLYKEVR